MGTNAVSPKEGQKRGATLILGEKVDVQLANIEK